MIATIHRAQDEGRLAHLQGRSRSFQKTLPLVSNSQHSCCSQTAVIGIIGAMLHWPVAVATRLALILAHGGEFGLLLLTQAMATGVAAGNGRTRPQTDRS